MNSSRALPFLTHMTALAGFVSLWISGQVGFFTSALFFSAIALSFANDYYGRNIYLGSRVSTLLAILVVAYLVSGVFLMGRELFGVILDFLILIQIVKLISAKDLRDIIQIYVLSFFQFLAGAVLTVDFAYGLVFVIYVVIAICSVMVFSMYKESQEASKIVLHDSRIITPRFISSTLLISVSVFAFAALVFITMPRIRNGFFISGFLKTNNLKSGFSDEVRLGRVGEIKLDDSPVMRVSILNKDRDQLSEPIYWKGVTLSSFDGISWKAPQNSYENYESDAYGVMLVSDSAGDSLHQEIITEPLNTDVLFAANTPVGFKKVPGNRVTRVGGSFLLPNKYYGRLKYYAYSDTSGPDKRRLEGTPAEYPPEIRSIYLQLPELSEEVTELAGEITSAESNPYDKAEAVRRYLATSLTYTRTLTEAEAGFPLDDFLFEKRAGHCEYFATAMAVLLRASGVPARIVNGFMGGEWNTHGRFFLVRESNAHSWVEVYFPGYGWVMFDPTPPDYESGTFAPLSVIGEYVDYLKFRWDRYIIDFNKRDQMRIYNHVRENVNWNGAKLGNLKRYKPYVDKKLILLAGLLAVTLWLIIRGPGIGLFSGRARIKPEHKASAIYRKGLSILATKGYIKPDCMTPREFANYLKSEYGPGFQDVARFTDHYLKARYGPDDNKDLSELRHKLKRLDADISPSG